MPSMPFTGMRLSAHIGEKLAPGGHYRSLTVQPTPSDPVHDVRHPPDGPLCFSRRLVTGIGRHCYRNFGGRRKDTPVPVPLSQIGAIKKPSIRDLCVQGV
jgi:hypothetical protein